MSNNFRTLMTMVVTTTNRVGMMIGTVIFQKVVHSVAPSARAASRISSGTDFSAAERIVMQNPVQIQMPTMINMYVLSPDVESQGIGLPPNAVMMEFSKPICTCCVP